MHLSLARMLATSLIAFAGSTAPEPANAPVHSYGRGIVVFEESRQTGIFLTKFRVNGPVSVREMAFLIHPYMARRCETKIPSLDSYDRQTKKEKGQELVSSATIQFRCRPAPRLPKANPHSFVKDMCGEFRASPLLQEACEPFLAE